MCFIWTHERSSSSPTVKARISHPPGAPTGVWPGSAKLKDIRCSTSRVWGLNSLIFPVRGSPPALPGLEVSLGDLEGENLLALGARGVSSRYWTVSAAASNTRWWPTLGTTAEARRIGELYEASVGP